MMVTNKKIYFQNQPRKLLFHSKIIYLVKNKERNKNKYTYKNKYKNKHKK